MWFEIIPAFSIIVGALAIPAFALPGINKFFLGNPNRRNLEERFDRVMYLRDFRLTGNPYKMSGLEAIPDEPEDEDNDKKKKTSGKSPPQKTSQVAEQKEIKEEVKELKNIVKEDDNLKSTPKECELKEEYQKVDVVEGKQNGEGEKAVHTEESIKVKENINK